MNPDFIANGDGRNILTFPIVEPASTAMVIPSIFTVPPELTLTSRIHLSLTCTECGGLLWESNGPNGWPLEGVHACSAIKP